MKTPAANTVRPRVYPETDDVVADCQRRFQGVCIKIYGPDRRTVVRTQVCVVRCPLLNRVIEVEEPP